jgi:2-dehydropantoate 2-reductase
VTAPGVVVHHDLNRFIIGEPDGSRSTRVLEIAKVLTAAGFDAPVRDNIRWNIWLKLWGNVCLNPISALTGATLERLVADPGLRALCKTMMLEARAVNEALGVQIPLEMAERRLAVAGTLVGHKMSMLQDLERGRRLEVDALVTAVQELGRLTQVPTPMIDAVLALIQARGRGAGLYVPVGSS